MAVGHSTLFRVELPWLTATSRRLLISMSCLVARLQEAANDGLITLHNCAFIAASSVSAKRRTDYAPRIVTACTPPIWFIPHNKRLATLGLAYLSESFWTARPYVKMTAEDTIMVQMRDTWRRAKITRLFQYILYGKSPSRVLLAVFDGPGDSHLTEQASG